jgi:hypothetical protein
MFDSDEHLIQQVICTSVCFASSCINGCISICKMKLVCVVRGKRASDDGDDFDQSDSKRQRLEELQSDVRILLASRVCHHNCYHFGSKPIIFKLCHYQWP